MRAREFTINIPVHIVINGDEPPTITSVTDPSAGNSLQQNPVMVSPQQQELELLKASLGKNSPVIDKLTADDSVGQEDQESADSFKELLRKILNSGNLKI